MSPNSNAHVPSSNPSVVPTEGALQRGRACLTCRRRKLKCDSARPVCQQCIRSHLESDCEYADSQGRTRTQMLEDEVARLQAIIQELENPASASGNVILHNPYSSQSNVNRTNAHIPSGADRTSLPWWELDCPPRQITDRLIQTFLTISVQLGFSLNIQRFVASTNLPPEDPSRPHPALLNAVLLWAVHLTPSGNRDTQIQALISRATASLTDAFGSVVSQKRVQALQAEVLLAQYFFCTGRFLEGKYHTGAAVSLALSCGMNRIRSSELTNVPPGSITSPSALLGSGSTDTVNAFNMTPARDIVEEGERINTFWAVFNIDRCWSVATGSPTVLYDDATLGTQIDTPWPLPMEVYEQMNNRITATFSRTVQRFLMGEPGQSPQNEVSGVALRAKVSALFNEATRLAAAWNPAQAQVGIPEMQRLHQVINHFIKGLIPLREAQNRSQEFGLQMLSVHILAHGSMIQLHNVRADFAPEASSFCVSHANEVIRLIDHCTVDNGGRVDFIVGTVLVAAAQVFTRERSKVRNSPMNGNTVARQTMCEANISRVITTLSSFSACPIMELQATKLQEILRG